MAFCPECGKSATANATKCVYCGTDLAPKQAAPVAGARFKGTMMMQSAPAAAPPAAAPETPAPPPAAAPAVAAPAPAPSSVPKPMLKATMVAQGMSPPPAAPGEENKKMAFAATQPQQSAYTPPAASAPAADGAEPKKYLPGDPMAPTGGGSKTHGGRGSLVTHTQGQPSNKTLIIVAVIGLLVIAGTGVGAAVYMGLLQLK